MKINEINKKIKKLKLPENQKDSILDLIDIKIESDMKEVINAIGNLKNELNVFDHKLETSIGSLKESILSNKSEINTSIGSLKSDLNTKFDSNRNERCNIRWMLGIVGTIAAAILGKMLKLF